MSTTRAAVVQEARSWINTPYQHQCCIKGVAVDCGRFVAGVCERLGILPEDFKLEANYSRQPDGVSLIELCDRWMYRIPTASVQAGDVLITHERDNALPNHFGIVADYYIGGRLSLIHAAATRDGGGRVLEQRIDAGMLARVAQAYRLPGVEA